MAENTGGKFSSFDGARCINNDVFNNGTTNSLAKKSLIIVSVFNMQVLNTMALTIKVTFVVFIALSYRCPIINSSHINVISQFCI